MSWRTPWFTVARVMLVIAALVASLVSLSASAIEPPKPDKTHEYASRNLVRNGSFESPDVTTFEYINPDFWVAIPPSPNTEVIRVEGVPADGEQWVELDSSGSSMIGQTLKTIPGTVYELSFSFAARALTEPEENVMRVGWDGIKSFTVGPTDDTAWKTYSFLVIARDAATDLTFADMGATSDSYGSYLDAVSVRAVPCVSVKHPTKSKTNWFDKETWRCGTKKSDYEKSKEIDAKPGKGNDVYIDKDTKVEVKDLDSKKDALAKNLKIESTSKLELASNKVVVAGDLLKYGTLDPIPGFFPSIMLDWSTTEAEIKKKIELMKETQGDGSSEQLEMIQLQALMDKQNQTMEMLSNMVSRFGELKSTIVEGLLERPMSDGEGFSARSADVSALNAPYTLTIEGQPLPVNSLVVDPGTVIEIAPDTQLTVLESVINNGQILLSEGSQLRLTPEVNITGAGTIEGPGTLQKNPPVFDPYTSAGPFEATGPGGAQVSYPVPTATDPNFGSLPVNCAPTPGSQFSLGSTEVTCSASDGFGNDISMTFDVAVVDTTAPDLAVASAPTEATSPDGALVVYSTTASDAVTATDDISVVCVDEDGAARPIGTQFAYGTTTLSCTATDLAGNVSAAQSLTISVIDTVAPVLSVVDRTVDATDLHGAVVTFENTATDAASRPEQISIVCRDANGVEWSSGAFFPNGVTVLSCVATDAHGLTSGAQTLTISVRSASSQLDDFRAFVADQTIGKGVKSGLLAKLDAARSSLARGQEHVSCNQLRAFTNQVQAQSGKSMTADLAQSLTGRAEQLRSVLGC